MVSLFTLCRMEQVGVDLYYGSSWLAHGFIGPCLHSPTMSRRHRKKKSKPPHTHTKPEKSTVSRAASREDKHQRQQRLSESGYETVGEQQATRTSSSTSSNSSKSETKSLEDPTTTSPAIKKLLKDLQRCDAFITKSLTSLHQVIVIAILLVSGSHVMISHYSNAALGRRSYNKSSLSCNNTSRPRRRTLPLS